VTIKELREELAGLPGDLQVFAVHGSSGASHEVEYVIVKKAEGYDAGPLIEKEGETVVIIGIDH